MSSGSYSTDLDLLVADVGGLLEEVDRGLELEERDVSIGNAGISIVSETTSTSGSRLAIAFLNASKS